MRSFLIVRYLLVCFGCIAACSSLQAMPDSLGVADSTGSYESVLYTGHFDFDCVPDTLIGFVQAPSFRTRPVRIVWGQDTALDCGSLPSHEDVSWFEYPEWDELWGEVSVLSYNQQDSLPDIFFTYGGKIDSGANRRDTSITVVLFGQDSIAALDSIPLSLNDTLQQSPFFALELIPSSRLLDSTHTDYSGFPSYELPLIFLDVDGDTTTPSIVFLSSVDDSEREQELKAEIFPNPTSHSTTLRVQPLPPGRYRIEAVSTEGALVYTQEIEVGTSGELFTPLDFSLLPSGYYQVVVRSNERILTAHSIAIVK